MPTTLTAKGQVTIPKRIRDALHLAPGAQIEFTVDAQGQVVLRRAGARARPTRARDRFEAARGTADVKWSTTELMALLRGDD